MSNVHNQALDNKAHIRGTLKLLFEPGQVFEIRVLDCPRPGAITAGYFDNYDLAAEAALTYSGRGPGVYVTLNQINPALLARINNRMEQWVKKTTSDADVLRRFWLPLDFDPVRPSGIPSTETEHAAALQRAGDCRDWLSDMGWTEPLEGDSGNGAHLLYPINLPNDEAARKLVEHCLQAIAWHWSDKEVVVDLTVSNAAQLWRLYGTRSAKGDGTPDRPHRDSRRLPLPKSWGEAVVVAELLEAVAKALPLLETRQTATPSPGVNGFDLASWIRQHNLPVAFEGPWANGGYKWVLSTCPFKGDGHYRKAYIVRSANGAIAAGCQAQSCSGNGWHELRDICEPAWREHHRLNGQGVSPKRRADAQPIAATWTPLSSVRPEAVEWVWQNRIPRGAVTLLDGDPGLGKSTITLDITARVSRGWGMPLELADGRQVRNPASVLLLSAEDSLSQTIRTRLEAAGADLDRVIALEAVRTTEGERPPVLPWDLALVEGRIAEEGIKLVVVDPFMAYLDGELDAHRDQDVRRCLHQLKLLAERTGVAILLVRHLNKLMGGPALYRGGGSIGITGAVRSAVVVGRDPADHERLVLATVKCNLARRPRSLTYAVEALDDASHIVWGQEVDLGPDDILEHPRAKRRASNGEQCADAIREILSEGPVKSAVLDQMLLARGFSARAQKEGRGLAKVRTRRQGFGAEGCWLVYLDDGQEAEGAP
jgi:hypothetical protein